MSLGRPVAGRGGAKAPRRSSPDGLVEERDYLRRSMEDLEDEHALGAVDDDDFELLRAHDEQRLAEVEEAIADLETRTDSGPRDGAVGGDRAPTDPQAQAGASACSPVPDRGDTDCAADSPTGGCER